MSHTRSKTQGLAGIERALGPTGSPSAPVKNYVEECAWLQVQGTDSMSLAGGRRQEAGQGAGQGIHAWPHWH